METTTTKTIEIQRIEEGDIERKIRNLQFEMASLVLVGEMTHKEANAWVEHKIEQWHAEARG
jgi:hypothetical protein